MKDVFIKKSWSNDFILFYLHFRNGRAIKQIEILPTVKRILSIENPIEGESMLYDGNLDELDLDETDFISKEEFDKIWENR